MTTLRLHSCLQCWTWWCRSMKWHSPAGCCPLGMVRHQRASSCTARVCFWFCCLTLWPWWPSGVTRIVAGWPRWRCTWTAPSHTWISQSAHWMTACLPRSRTCLHYSRGWRWVSFCPVWACTACLATGRIGVARGWQTAWSRYHSVHRVMRRLCQFPMFLRISHLVSPIGTASIQMSYLLSRVI